MSSAKGTRLTRSKATRSPFAAMVNSSPSLSEPLTSVVSLPAPPSIRSEPSPLFQTIRSLPAPPRMVSPPRKPTSTSSPAPPQSASSPSPPVIESSPAPPSRLQLDQPVEPLGAGDGVIAALAVHLQGLGGADVERERHEVDPVEVHPVAVGGDGELVPVVVGAVDLGGVLAGAAFHQVRAVAVVPDHAVVALAAEHLVAAAVADQEIVPRLAPQRVVAVAAEQGVVAAAAADDVVAAERVDGVVVAGSDDDVVAFGRRAHRCGSPCHVNLLGFRSAGRCRQTEVP